MPLRTILIVFGSLVTLTFVTWFTARFVDLHGFNVPLAIAIAATKATLVVLFFMALKYDARGNALIFSVGVLFVLVFMVFTSLDVFFRDMVDPIKAGTIMDRQVVDAELRARDSLVTPMLKAQPLVFSGDASDVVVDSTAGAGQ